MVVVLLAAALVVVGALMIMERLENRKLAHKAERFDEHCRWNLLMLRTLRAKLEQPLSREGAAQEVVYRLTHEPNDVALCTRAYRPPALRDACDMHDYACLSRFAAQAEEGIVRGLD